MLKPCTVRVVEGFGISISKVDRGRSCKDDLRGSLDDQQPLTVALRQHGHRPALKIEWNFIQFRPKLEAIVGASIDDRPIERAPNAAAEATIYSGKRENTLAFDAVRARTADEGNAGFGQRSGLVGTQHVHRAEVVDGGEPFDHHCLFGHADSTARQRHRHDHREQLWRQTHGERHRKQEGFQHRASECEVRQEDEQHQEDGQTQN